MLSPVPSRYFLGIAIFVICLALPSSNGVHYTNKICSSRLFSCGRKFKNIGYPFWGDGRPPYCGHPALRLQCLNSENGDPVLKIGRELEVPYEVLHMNYSRQFNFSLILRGLQNIHCPFDWLGYSEVLKFSQNDENITLIYKCKRDPNNFHGSAPCFLKPSTSDLAYYLYNLSALKEYASCKSFEFPVIRKELDRYNKGTGHFTDVLKQGFEVMYEYSSDCTDCYKSGSTCGSSDDSGFMCFHKSVNWKLILGIGIPGGLMILVALNIGLCYFLKLRFRSPVLLSRIISTDPTISDLETGGSFNGIPVFPFSELQDATNNFDEIQKLGDGGFGIVYYGKLRDGREVAVKRLYEKNYKSPKSCYPLRVHTTTQSRASTRL